ncbi:hypothetical protein ACTFIY_012455 [Dictyostelium cf. discoideum]
MSFNNNNNNNNNSNNYESDNDEDEDEDEENLLFKDFQSLERRGNKKINYNNNYNNNNKNKNNDIKEKNIKNNKITNKNNHNNKNFISKLSIINKNNNKFKKIKNIILQKKNLKNLIIIILSLFFILFLFYIIITFSINNKIYNYTNNKIINNKNDIINQYCINFNKIINNKNNNNNKEEVEEKEEDDDDEEEKCSFDLNSPDYSCTPISKNRVINFNYSSNYEERVINWNKPIVSVIVPFLNTDPQQFNECMESILIRQSFKLIEVILIDDGSTNDKSIKSYREWLKREPIRVRVIVNPFNLGLPHSRNIGVYNSRGDYIFFFDSDDILEPTALEKMLWKLNTSSHIQFTKGYLVGFGHTQYIWLKGFEQADKFLIENQVTISIMYKRSMFGNKLQINQSFQVDDYSYGEYFHYPKELLEFQYDSNIRDGMEDWDFHLKCASAGYWGETIPEILEWYRRKDKKTMEKNWKNTLTSKREKFLNDLKLKYSKLYNIGGGGGNDNQYKSFPNPIRNENEDSFKIKFTGSCSGGGSGGSSSSCNEIKNPLIKKSSIPRILFILPWLNTGGADKFNLNLCKQLVEKGWEITIVTTIESDNKWLSRFQLYTPDIFLFNEKFLSYSSYPSFINYLIDSRNIDVLFISNSEFGYYLLPFIKSNKYNNININNNNNNLIIVDYNHMEEEYWRNGGHPRQSIGMSQFIDLHLVSSNHLKNWMLAKSNQMIDENKILVTYINVDMDEFKKSESSRYDIRKSYDITEKEIVILYAARLTDQKKPLEACEIIKELKESLLNDFENNYQNQNQNQLFKVLFVGDGYLKSKVELYVKQNGLSDVIKLLGDVPTQDMKYIISACDIVFLPSQFEGVSMIFYESMSIGLVPVGSNVGGQSELVTPDCGFLVDITDGGGGGNDIDPLEFTNKFVQILKQLIKNPKKITSMASKCKKRIKSNFQLHKMGGDIISNFCNTIKKKNNQLSQQQKQQQQQQQQQSLQLNDGGLFNQEFLIQTIEYLKLTNQFEKKKNDLNQLYSLQSELDRLKREIKKLELKQSQK